MSRVAVMVTYTEKGVAWLDRQLGLTDRLRDLDEIGRHLHF